MRMAAKLGFVAFLMVTSLVVPETGRALAPAITVVAGTGLGGLTHTIPIGGGVFMQVTLSFQDLGGLLDTQKADSAAGADLYVGAILPDGRFKSWVGDPQASTFVTGQAPVPLLAGFVPEEGEQYSLAFSPSQPAIRRVGTSSTDWSSVPARIRWTRANGAGGTPRPSTPSSSPRL